MTSGGEMTNVQALALAALERAVRVSQAVGRREPRVALSQLRELRVEVDRLEAELRGRS